MKNNTSHGSKKQLPLICIVLFLLAATSAVIYLLFTQSTAFSDLWNETVAAFLRRILAYLTAWIPFSLAELLLILVPVILAVVIGVGIRHYTASNRDALIYVGIVLSVVSLVFTSFVWCFAPGYYGTTLDRKLGLERQKSAAEELAATALLLSRELEELTDDVLFLENGSSLMPYSHAEMNRHLREAYAKAAEKYDFLSHFYSKVKPVMLSEPMSYTHITGVYTFFTGEANLNVVFPDYTLPFTAAHEMAHQRGIAREDEANFVAFLVCMESEDAYIRYCGYLNLYEYVVGALATADRTLYGKIAETLPREVTHELTAYAEFFEKYKENTAANVSASVNNSYLQSQGAVEGTRSYGMVVDLAVAYYREQFAE